MRCVYGVAFLHTHFPFICCITLTLLLLLRFWWRLRAVDGLIERNSWFVAKKVKVCVWIALRFVQHAHARRRCTKNKSGRQNASYIYIIRGFRISRYSIIIAWYFRCKRCRQRETRFRSNHLLLLHSFDFDGFGALLFVILGFEI